MRFVALVLAPLLLTVAGGAAAWAEETLPTITLDEETPAAAEPTRAERIDALFETLRTTKDESEAKQAERTILSLWLESDSDTVDLLMDWALSAMQEKSYPRALDFLDRVIVMRPDYVEGWNKRATVYYLMEDYGQSIADIGRVLELEPRHFGALSGFGMVLQAIGDDERAIAAFRSALAVDPHLDTVRDALDELEAKNFGQAL